MVDENNSNVSSNSDSPEHWSAKFLILVITEASGQTPSLEQVKGVLENTYPKLSASEISSIHLSVLALCKNSANSKAEWDKIWDNFSIQLKTFKLSETFSAVREIASNAFHLKMEEGMEEVAQKFVYRMSQFEKYLQISKTDYLAILEEEKENTGYNAFKKNL
jgi:hypothetical protein